MGLIITRPLGGSGTIPQVSDIVETIDPMQNKDVDVTSNVNILGVNWYIAIQNDNSKQAMIFQINAIKTGENDVSYTIYGITGNLLPHFINITNASNIITLNINNTSTDLYNIHIIRINV